MLQLSLSTAMTGNQNRNRTTSLQCWQGSNLDIGYEAIDKLLDY